MARPNRSRPPDVLSGRQASPSPNRGKPELIVIAKPEAQMRVLEGAPASLGAGIAVAPLAALLAAAGAVLRPLFGPNDEHVRLMAALLPRVLNRQVPDLTGYYHVEAPAEQLESLAKTPGGPSYGDLRLSPVWDPLRGDPGFEKVVASLAPKS